MKKLLSIYILLILAFSILYYFFWIFKPDYFVFSSSLNLHPISSNNIVENDNITLEGFQKYADSIRKEKIQTVNDIKSSNRKRDSIKILKDFYYKDFDKSRWDEIEKFENDSTYLLLIKKKEILDEKINNTKDGVEKANLTVKSSNINVEISEYILKKKNYTLENLGKFGDREKLKKVKYFDSIYYLYDITIIPNLNQKKFQLDYEIENLRFKYLSKHTEKINFIDFILFSASNSTTISSGDIIPNSNLIKIMVILQGLISIILFALITEKIIINYQSNLKNNK